MADNKYKIISFLLLQLPLGSDLGLLQYTVGRKQASWLGLK
jgi:hypothetical protein